MGYGNGKRRLDRVYVDHEHFNKVLRERGWTIKALGEDRDVDRSAKSIQAYLRVEKMPSFLVERIAAKLGVTVRELIRP